MKNYFLALLVAGIFMSIPGNTTCYPDNIDNEPEHMKVRMVLFTAADVETPEDYLERFKGMADYTEAFFAKWMNHWSYPCDNPFRIERDAQGYPVVLAIKGEHNRDHESYEKLEGIKKEVLRQAETKFNISGDGQVWWILNYPRKKRGSRGGGNAMTGGTSFGNYMDSDEQIDLAMEMAEGMHETILLKSLIHELTHALGLGHIGPHDMDNLGNSLMGAVNKAYKKMKGDDPRVYLSEAGAAMLWKHPLFDGKNDGSVSTPEVEVKGLKAIYDKEKNQFIVEGRLKSNILAHSVVVSNASEADRSPYWHKAFVGKVQKNGKFKCVISELNHAGGEIKIAFAFHNGVISGDGDKIGLNKSAIIKKYVYDDQGFLFE